MQQSKLIIMFVLNDLKKIEKTRFYNKFQVFQLLK